MNYATDATGLIPLLPLDTEDNDNSKLEEEEEVCVLDDEDEEDEEIMETCLYTSTSDQEEEEEEEDNTPDDVKRLADSCNTIEDIRMMIDTIGGLDGKKQAYSMLKLRVCLDRVAENIAGNVKEYFSLFSSKDIFSNVVERKFFTLEDQKREDFAASQYGPLIMPKNYADIPLVPKLETALHDARGGNMVEMIPCEVWDIIFKMTGHTRFPRLYGKLRSVCKHFKNSIGVKNTERMIFRSVKMSLAESQKYKILSSEVELLKAAGEWASQLVCSMPETIETLNINLNTISSFMIGVDVDRFKPREVVPPYHMRNCTSVIFTWIMQTLVERKHVKKLVLTRSPDTSKGMPLFNTILLENVFNEIANRVDKTGVHVLDISGLEVESCPRSLLDVLKKMKNVDTLVCDNICLDGCTFRGTVKLRYLIANSVYFNPITFAIGEITYDPKKYDSRGMSRYTNIFRYKNLNIVCNFLKGTGCTDCVYKGKEVDFKGHNRIFSSVKRSIARTVKCCCIDKLFYSARWTIENLFITQRLIDPSVSHSCFEQEYMNTKYCHSALMVTANEKSVMQWFKRPTKGQVKKHLEYEVVKVPEEIHESKRTGARRLRNKLRKLEKQGRDEQETLIKFMEREIETLKKKRSSPDPRSYALYKQQQQQQQQQEQKKRKRTIESSESSSDYSSEEEEDMPKMIEKKVYKDPDSKLMHALNSGTGLDLAEPKTKQDWLPHFKTIVNEATLLYMKDFEDRTKDECIGDERALLINPSLILGMGTVSE